MAANGAQVGTPEFVVGDLDRYAEENAGLFPGQHESSLPSKENAVTLGPSLFEPGAPGSGAMRLRSAIEPIPLVLNLERAAPPTGSADGQGQSEAPGLRHPTSQCVAVSLKLLRRQSPGLRLVVSYADAGQGHVGTIYQATGWLYLGTSDQSYLRIAGQVVHPRTVYDRYGRGGQSVAWLRKNVDPKACRVPMAPKLKSPPSRAKTISSGSTRTSTCRPHHSKGTG